MRFIIYLFLLLSFPAWSQTSLSGTIVDTTGNSLPGANVVLLRQVDSSLVAFGSTDTRGSFNMEKVPAGDYLLRCSFVGYQRPEQKLSIDTEDQLLDLGELQMYPEGFLLDGIEVNGYRIPIRMRGDTMVFDAESFAAGPNAVVEDLLRRLPGMSIDQSGAILFNGKAVREVMVNGKPFFRGNSQIVTKNLDAAAVDKVEVFDQKTDSEIVSGVDDRQEDITINLAIKEDAKNQPFGQLYAGGGSDNRYQAGGKAFRIGDRSQLGFLGLFNNTNQTGFDIGTVMGWSASGDFQLGGDGNQGQIPVNWRNPPTGDNRTTSAGLNYGTSIGNRSNLSMSYVLLDRNQQLTARERDVYQGALLDQESLLLRQQQKTNYAHRITVDVDTKADTVSGFDLQLAAYTTGQRNNEITDGELLNAGTATAFSSMNQTSEMRPGLSMKASYDRRLGRRGRTLGIEQSLLFEDRDQDLFNEQTGFMDLMLPGLAAGNTVDQMYRSPSGNSKTGISFTQPLNEQFRWKNELVLELMRDQLEIDFLNEEGTKSLYALTNQQVQPSLESSLDWQGEKGSFSLGMQLLQLDWQLSGAIQRQEQSRHWLPQLQYRLEFKKGTYQAFVRSQLSVPNSRNLQQIVQPSGGFATRQGNEQLGIGKQYSLVNFVYYGDNFSGLNGSLQMTNTYTDNPISYQLNFDDQQQQYQLINVTHQWVNSLRANLEQRLDFLEGSVGIRGNLRQIINPVLINEVATTSQTSSWQIEGFFSKGINEKSFTRLAYLQGWNRNELASEVAGVQNTVSRISAQLQLEFNPKWRWETDFNYEKFSGIGASTTLLNWNASLEVRPFAKAAHYFVLTGFDLLNQNAAVTQEAQTFLIRSRQTNALGRYLMLSFHWKL